jgi:hypothetical protein
LLTRQAVRKSGSPHSREARPTGFPDSLLGLGYNRFMRTVLGLWVVSLCCVIGCDEGHGPRAPDAPQSGGVIITERRPDAGHPLDEDAGLNADAGVSDGGASMPSAYACERVDVLHSTGGDMPAATATDQPADFAVSRQAVGFSADCSLLTIELSNGTCPRGDGHELEFTLNVAGIEDGLIRLANNEVSADSSNIIVRYTRPSTLTPNGVWGSCGSATGQLVFLEAPDLTMSANWQANFQLLLAPCDGTTNAPIEVDGEFDFALRFNLATACPDATATPSP